MKSHGKDVSVFRYPIHIIVGIALLPVIAAIALLCIIVTACFQHTYVDAAWEFLLLLMILYIIPPLSLSIASIRVEHDGVSSHFLGFKTQSYKWNEIKKIRKTKSLNNIYKPNEFVDFILRERSGANMMYNLFGIIRASNLICDYEKFKAEINNNAMTNKIPLSYVDEKMARSRSSPEERTILMRDGVSVERI